MAEYINRDDLLNAINTNVAEAHNERCSQLLEAILNAPIADVVEVVRCKDCKRCDNCFPIKEKDKSPLEGWFCKRRYSYVNPYDYCSYGERRGGNN